MLYKGKKEDTDKVEKIEAAVETLDKIMEFTKKITLSDKPKSEEKSTELTSDTSKIQGEEQKLKSTEGLKAGAYTDGTNIISKEEQEKASRPVVAPQRKGEDNVEIRKPQNICETKTTEETTKAKVEKKPEKVENSTVSEESETTTGEVNHKIKPQVKCVDNLILHDSTGKHFEAQKTYGKEVCHKQWAPYVSMARKELKEFQVSGSIVLMNGVRKARQLTEGITTLHKIKNELREFMEEVKKTSPKAKVLIMSALPNTTEAVIAACEDTNRISKEIESEYRSTVKYVDTFNNLNKSYMNDIHPTNAAMPIFSREIRKALGKPVRRETHNYNYIPPQNYIPPPNMVRQTEWPVLPSRMPVSSEWNPLVQPVKWTMV